QRGLVEAPVRYLDGVRVVVEQALNRRGGRSNGDDVAELRALHLAAATPAGDRQRAGAARFEHDVVGTYESAAESRRVPVKDEARSIVHECDWPLTLLVDCEAEGVHRRRGSARRADREHVVDA